MKKPEKKNGNFDNDPYCSSCRLSEDFCQCAGYDQCWEDREKWLPSEEEIEKICEKVVCKDYRYKKDIAKAIAKRLRGEK